MTDRKELIERLKHHLNHFWGNAEAKKDVEDAIAALSDQWIPVSERLPEVAGVWPVKVSGQVTYAYFSNYYKTKWWADSDKKESINVAMWFELPAPPED